MPRASLNALASGARRLGVGELAQRLELAPGTVHGLLQALQAHGFVEQDRDSGKYQPGAGLLQLGTSYLDLNELRARSLVHAERLAVRRDAAVRVGVQWRERDRGSPRVPPPTRRCRFLEVGAQLPTHASALGKAILAYLPSSVVDDLTAEPLPRLTSRMLIARELRAQFESIRERGVARERDEAILREAGVAAPIFDHSGHAVGAVGVVGDTERIVRAGRQGPRRRGRRGGRRHFPRAQSALLAGTGRAAPPLIR